MLIIRSSADLADALNSLLPSNLKALLALRRDQIAEHADYDLGELAHFIVVAPGDTLVAIETLAGVPFTPDPPWEWVLAHGRLFEAPIIVSDDGFGFVLMVPDIEGVDATLIQLLRIDANA